MGETTCIYLADDDVEDQELSIEALTDIDSSLHVSLQGSQGGAYKIADNVSPFLP